MLASRAGAAVRLQQQQRKVVIDASGVIVGMDRNSGDGEALPALAELARSEPHPTILQHLGEAVAGILALGDAMGGGQHEVGRDQRRAAAVLALFIAAQLQELRFVPGSFASASISAGV